MRSCETIASQLVVGVKMPTFESGSNSISAEAASDCGFVFCSSLFEIGTVTSSTFARLEGTDPYATFVAWRVQFGVVRLEM
jgi:hypothetical protein